MHTVGKIDGASGKNTNKIFMGRDHASASLICITACGDIAVKCKVSYVNQPHQNNFGFGPVVFCWFLDCALEVGGSRVKSFLLLLLQVGILHG